MREGLDLAIRHFQNAFDHFKKVSHLLGMMQSKKHISELFDTYVNSLLHGRKTSDDKDEKDKLEARQKMEKYTKKFNDYIEKHGISKCPYLPRAHGLDISLMAEIVHENQ